MGFKTRDDATEIDITKADGEVVITVAKSDIKELEQDDHASRHARRPLTEAMTVKDFQDVLAFLMMQKGE